jgi:hypothetical protein
VLIRYKKQTDEFRCLPIAVINAMKWAGVRASYDEWSDFLCTMCDTEVGHGTSETDGVKVVKFMAREFKAFDVVSVVERFTFRPLHKHVVEEDGAVIVASEMYFEPVNHASLLIRHQNSIAIVNGFADRKESTVLKLDKAVLGKRILGHRSRRINLGIFLTKR